MKNDEKIFFVNPINLQVKLLTMYLPLRIALGGEVVAVGVDESVFIRTLVVAAAVNANIPMRSVSAAQSACPVTRQVLA